MSQLQAGLAPADITAQLINAGWTEPDIQNAFTAAQAQISPSLTQVPVQQSPPNSQDVADNQAAGAPGQEPIQRQQLPPPINRGRLKTGWLLFKQSFSIIKSNPALWQYMILSITITFLVSAAIIGLFIFDYLQENILSQSTIEIQDNQAAMVTSPTPLGFLVLFLTGLLTTTITFYYATALASHVFSIFKAEATTHTQHLIVARKKLPTIFTYAFISLVVGYILTMLEQRFKLIGWIVSKILGILWALGTVFVIPVIADTDENAVTAIKSSIGMFKDTWGETITGRVALTGLMIIFYLLVMAPVTVALMFILANAFGAAGFIIAIGIFIIGIIMLGIVSALATNVLNVALYYYAKNGTVPASFSPELLASVFTQKKPRRR